MSRGSSGKGSYRKTARWALTLALALLVGFAIPQLLSMLAVQVAPRAPTQPVGTPRQEGFEAPISTAALNVPPGLRTFSSLSELKSFVSALREAELEAERLSEYLSTTPILPIYVGRAAPASFPLSVAQEKAGPEYSRTNIQVEGVDEPDIVKTDGRVIAAVSGSRVYLVSAAQRRVASVVEPPLAPRGVYIADSKLIVVCAAPEYRVLPVDRVPSPGKPISALLVYDISDPAKPRLLSNATVTGWFSASRMTGRNVYLVALQPIAEVEIPEVNGRPIDPGRVVAVSPRANGYINVLALDLLAGRVETLSILTELSGRGWFYMSGERLYVGYSAAPRVEELYEQFLRSLSGLVPEELYSRVVSQLARGNITGALEAFLEYVSRLSFEEAHRLAAEAAARVRLSWDGTSFHVFRVNGTAVGYLGSFSVPGVVLDQFSMEEHRGYFIVAATRAAWVVKGVVVEGPRVVPREPGELRVVECEEARCVEKVVKLNTTQYPAGWRRFYVSLWPEALEPDNCVFTVRLADLKVVGNLSGLAPGERVYSSRLVGDTFYLVTYRNVDPLFAIDVSDPAAPRVLGYVKIPGFSEYLHPLPGGLLLGVGLDPDSSSLKVSLFDVSDPGAMREISSVRLAGAYSPALQDHHAVQVWLSRSLALIPLTARGNIEGVAVFEIKERAVSFTTLLEHPGASRSLYIGSEIYTVSPSQVRVFDADSFNQVAEIPLELAGRSSG
ncbi:MAG: beta-propeller domain-containing protein [Thermofilum sp.]